MSEIGQIYSRYKDALDWSIDEFCHDQERSLEAMRQFYPDVLKYFIRDFSWIRERDSARWTQALKNLRSEFGGGNKSITFTAIDGTCGKEPLSELVVFYGAAYAQGGTLTIDEDVGELVFHKWSPAEDTSVVAYLPIPLSRLDLFEDEGWIFRNDDEDRATANVIHTGLMQLAEIYLAYRRATAQDNPPQVILLDNSISSIYMSSDVLYLAKPYSGESQVLGWIGADISRWSRVFEPVDALVAYSHPMNRSIGVPSMKMNSLAESIVARMTDYWQIGDIGDRDIGQEISIDSVIQEGQFQIDEGQFSHRIERMVSRYQAFRIENKTIKPLDESTRKNGRTLRQRWYDLRLLFEHICEQLFRERRVEALQLNYPRDSQRRGPKWMSESDLKFLIGLGLRLLIECCWQKNILLLGVAKDSTSRYFSRNYLSVMKATNLCTIVDTPEPAGSDRLICEMAPIIDDNIKAPWGTIEFDSVFMTLRAREDSGGKISCAGVRGDVLAPTDGLFLRSLMQLFLLRRPNKQIPVMGHVLFLDRLAYPYFDSGKRSPTPISTRDSIINPLFFKDAESGNLGQDVAMLIADLLTRNCFPEAIGQPDPLHRADQGAKALGKRIDNLVQASIQRLKTNPLSWSFRDLRARLGG